MNINEIENQMINLITEDKLTTEILKGLLLDDNYVISFIGDPYFIEKFEEIFEILASDVDNDGKITINDLQTTLQRSLEYLESVYENIELLLLSYNAKVGVRLVENILIIMTEILGKKITLSIDKIKIILFKTMVYFLIEILPRGSNRDYRYETQIILIQMISRLLNSLVSMHLLSITVIKINNLIPDVNGFFSFCFCGKKSIPKSLIAIHQRRLQQKLIFDARLIGSKIAQKKKILQLQKEIDTLKNNDTKSEEQEPLDLTIINGENTCLNIEESEESGESGESLNNLPLNE
jgi:hypothetical protein